VRKKPVESKADAVRRKLREQAASQKAVKAGAVPGLDVEYSGDSGSVTGNLESAKRVVSPEDVLEAANVDQKTWYVKSCKIKKWEMGFKDADQQPGFIPLWGVSITLERIVKKCYSDSLELLFKSLRTLPRITTKPKAHGDRLLVPCLFDVHLGKYAWGLETGTDQDTEIQRLVFRNAMTDLIHLSGGNFERILFPIGNDFFQVNNWLNTTAKGTAVDHDGRFPKVFDAGCQEIINAIERLLQVAPVDVVWVPGNHDPETSYALAMVIEARFWHHKHVAVDRSPSPRKYFRYGKTLLGLTHGNEEKTADLPVLMAQECAQHWSETSTREWLTGHVHHKRAFTTKDTLEKMGVVMRTVRALSGTDSWHHAKGFVGAHRAAEAYIYGRDVGYMGHWSVESRV
jgi:hypothetical protein